MMNTSHHHYMALALQLAQRGRYSAAPNPCVGSVIVKGGQVIGDGWHQRAGESHAEINALHAAGDNVAGATVYVTLEPCSHHGRTSPCADALVRAGVARVVYGMQDPNPRVSGRGLERLEKAGIEVIGPVLAQQAEALNPGFCKRMCTGLPKVTVKLAMSLDGRTAMASGESKWITGPAARRDVQRMRAASCAIITGIGTVLKDNPAMTVRDDELELSHSIRQPLRVVVDSCGQLSADANIVRQPGEVLVVTAGPVVDGVQTVSLPAADGQVDLNALLQELGQRECNEVLVESGSELAGAFVTAGVVDELVVYMAPKLLGSSARPLLTLPFDTMAQQVELNIIDIRAVGDDFRITARLKTDSVRRPASDVRPGT